MCLSVVYKVEEPTEPVFDSVKKVDVSGDSIVFTDILGDELTVKGTIERVDFVENAIYVAAVG